MLTELKQDFSVLLDVYREMGGEPAQDRNHNPCPICKDATAFVLYECNKQSGRPSWHCFKCGEKGSVVDLVSHARGTDPKEAIRWVLERFRDRVAGSAGGAASSARDTRTEANSHPAPGGRAANGGGDRVPVADSKKPKKVHATIDEAVDACAWGLRQRKGVDAVVEFGRWRYQETEVDPGFYVVRFDFVQEKNGQQKACKEIRFIRYASGGWICDKGDWGGEQKRCPVYGLPQLAVVLNGTEAGQTTIHVVEGEKCAAAMNGDAATLATTSQGGSGRAAESDWAPVARFSRVILWPDCDEQGLRYIDDVARAVRGHNPTAVIDVVDLKKLGLKDGQDVYDLITEMVSEGKDQTAISAQMVAVVDRYAEPWSPKKEPQKPDEPWTPSVIPTESKEKPELSNFAWEKRTKTDKKTGEVEEIYVPIARGVEEIRRELLRVMNGWPARIHSPASKVPLLFVDTGEGDDVEWIRTPARFLRAMHDACVLKFKGGADANGRNFVTIETLFEDFGSSNEVREFLHVELYPHYPRLKGHYYKWRPMPGYKPDGKRLAQLVSFFADNVPTLAARAIYAAAVVTPFWGGPAGKRPAFFFDAAHRGSGKTTMATIAANLCGRPLSINLDQRAEDRLKERLLSPEAFHQRIGLVDNVKGAVVSGLLDELVTCESISGKRLYQGEASRPNTMVYMLTANDARLSPDMARRSFFIQCQPPPYNAAWERMLQEFLDLHGREVIEDCIWILEHLQGQFAWGNIKGETFTRWCEDVLGPVLRCGSVAEVVEGIAPEKVLEWNQACRSESDEELEQANKFKEGLLERVAAWKGFGPMSMVEPSEDIFIRTESPPTRETMSDDDYRVAEREKSNNMVAYWRDIFQRREVNSTWVARTLKAHILAGRIDGLYQHRKQHERGWMLSSEVMREWISESRKGQSMTAMTSMTG